MKKIFKRIVLIAALAASFPSASFAQSTQRNAKTVVGDALNRLPATDMKLYDELATELIGTGKDGMDLLYDMLVKQDDSMVPVEYAFSAIAAKATEVGGETAQTVTGCLRSYADKSRDTTVKQLFVRLLMFMGDNYENKNTTVVSELDPGTTAAPTVKELVKTLKSKNTDNVALFDELYRVNDVAAAKEAIVKNIASVKSDAIKADLVWWLGEQKDGSLIDFYRQYLSCSDSTLRSEAAWALTKTADASVLPDLAALVGSEKDAATAEACLKSFPGKVVAAVTPYFDRAGENGKTAIIDLIGQRHSVADKNLVFGSLCNSSAKVSDAAYSALACVSQECDINTLYGLLESSTSDNVSKIQDAVLAAMDDKTDAEIYEILNNRNRIVAESIKSKYWPMIIKVADIPQTLTILADNMNNTSLADYALEAYINKVNASGENGTQRLLRYRAAMEYTTTDAQKVSLLNNVATTEAFPGIIYAGRFLDNKGTEVAAANAIRRIAISNPSFYGPEVVALMQRIKSIDTGRDYSYDLQNIEKYLAGVPADDEGFVSMFNGKDLTGWQGMIPTNGYGEGNPYLRDALPAKKRAAAQAEADKVMRQDWTVANGNIEYVGQGYNNLVSTKKYKDFEMYVDWKIYPGQREGDGGIYLRSCPQVQIWDTARTWVHAEMGSGALYNNQKTERKPLVIADNAVGEWNSFYIRMQGERVTVYLNGQKVVDNIVLENYWDRSLPIPEEGYIELQAHGSRLAYRDLYIHELPGIEPVRLSDEEKAEGFEMLFDGTSLHKWHGNKIDYNVVNGEIAVESRSRGGSDSGDLYTNEEYCDFAFRFEFKLTPGANNGVGVRAPGEGDAAYVGYEVQILDHFNDIYKGWLAPYQHHGSLYGIIPAKKLDALNPVGEWNSEEIYMKGNYIRVTVNGQVVTEGDIAEATKNGTIDGQDHPGLKRTCGYIGFLGHGDRLWIRNVRVKRL